MSTLLVLRVIVIGQL